MFLCCMHRVCDVFVCINACAHTVQDDTISAQLFRLLAHLTYKLYYTYCTAAYVYMHTPKGNNTQCCARPRCGTEKLGQASQTKLNASLVVQLQVSGIYTKIALVSLLYYTVEQFAYSNLCHDKQVVLGKHSSYMQQ